MSVLTVGAGQQFSTIAAAVNAAADGDTIDVQSGTYTNDFVSIQKNLTLNAIGGAVTMQATVQPSNGKAILTEGASGITVNIDGFLFKGATVPDQNGAGIRYEGGTLHIANSGFFDSQNGILGGIDPNGVITIDHSEFANNGIGGDGHTHNIYIGDIASFSLTNSFSHDANVGHEIKSRAENNTITNNVILDNNSSSSYEIDLPNGGNAMISGNTIQQGPNSQNPNIIAYGEEGVRYSGASLSITGNTIVNDMGRGPAVWNASGNTAVFADNAVYGFGAAPLVNGPSTQSGTTVLTSRPSLVQAVPSTAAPTPTPSQAPPPAAIQATPSSTSGLVLAISEDAYQGDAQFTVSVDGQQFGGVHTASASHSAGTKEFVAVGPLAAGPHSISVAFINDKWDGTAATDRNLYLDGAFYNGQNVAGAAATLLSNGAATFAATGDQASPPPSAVVSPAPTSPPPSASGGDAGLVIGVSEDAYQGDAQFTVSVDGAQIGGIYTATALHRQGAPTSIGIGALAAGSHQIAVAFINDKYDGSLATDRNLYVDSIAYNGAPIPSSTANLWSNGAAQFTVTGDQPAVGIVAPPAPASSPAPVASTTPAAPESTPGLVVTVSEDAYQGDAQFTVSVDGEQVGGVHTATASHGLGATQSITIGALAAGSHQIAVAFINDKYDGTPSTDRNLYVDAIAYNGAPIQGGSASLWSNGAATFAVAGNPTTSTLVVNVSEDAYQGDAQFTIAIDGQQMGGIYAATESRSAGQSQPITLAGIPERFTPHDIAITFLNDRYDGTPATDRNLYVNSILFDNQTVPGGSSALYSAGTQHFTAMAPANWA